MGSGPRWTSLRPRTRYAPSNLSLEFDEHIAEEQRPNISPEGPRPPRSLLLLTRSRGVQTDVVTESRSALDPSPIPRMLGDLSQDGQSESSSLADNSTTVIGVLVERVSLLLNRLMQADAFTLTTRLKRQHLLGADVSHLSRSTVSGILNESNALRAQFRAFLEDERITTTCTRRDLRALFKLFKDMFSEMGQLRVTLNDVILDPTVAGKVSDMAMRPSNSGSIAVSDAATSGTSSTPSWMAPLTKLLGLPGGSGADEAAARALSPPARLSGRIPIKPPARMVPKREPALSASTMTVNVEFSGGGVGRAVTSTVSNQPPPDRPVLTASASTSSQIASVSGSEPPSRSVMDIFAGAPRLADNSDPWVVVPKARQAGLNGGYDGAATVGRSAARTTSVANLRGASTLDTVGREAGKSLSRIVDAVIDLPQSPELQSEDVSEARDVVPDTLLDRTLRPRGLSDSSIHTTFLNHASGNEQTGQEFRGSQSAKPDKQSVLQALSRRMQSFRLASSSFAVPARPSSVAGPVTTGMNSESTPHVSAEVATSEASREASGAITGLGRATSSSNALLQSLNFASWAAAALPVDGLEEETNHITPGPFYVGTVREESTISREWTRGREI